MIIKDCDILFSCSGKLALKETVQNEEASTCLSQYLTKKFKNLHILIRLPNRILWWYVPDLCVSEPKVWDVSVPWTKPA